MNFKEKFWSWKLLFIYASSPVIVRDISIYGTCFLFAIIVQKVKVFCFSDPLNQKMTQQSDVTSDSQLLYKFFKSSLFISANTYEKYTVSKDYCTARQDDKMCFLPNCRYHVILMEDFKGFQQTLDPICFNYQHVDCLYTLFKYRFSSKIVVRKTQLFKNLQSVVYFNHQSRRMDRMPIIAKKRILRKKYKKPLLSSFQKTK